jgi:T5SS/PEP-CTERM-associated repeat protein
MGSRNQLVVSNGGLVVNGNGIVGRDARSIGNLAIVSGAGSVWSNRQTLTIGESGNGNRLEVCNGGRVESLVATLGDFDSASNNVAVVTGSGSLWRAEEDGSLTVGFRGGGNRLVITNGAWVRGGGVIGMVSSSTNNEVVVTGAGSSWTNLNGLVVGNSGNRNRLVITNGGEVFSDRGVTLGLSPGATNNRIVLDGGALRALDLVEGILDVRRGTNVLNAGLIDVNRLLLTNALSVFEFNGGTLITRGALITNNAQFTVGNAGGTPALWDVRGGAGSHYTRNSLLVGGAASFAQLIHTNGALLTNDSAAFLGRDATSRSNSVTLAGPASRWWLGDGVVVGEAGSDNRLLVRDGASLVTASISYLGAQITSSNNEAVVTGPGSSWNSNPEYGLSVGYRGRNNRMRVNNGGQIASGPSVIGELPTGSNNLALVTDAGSLWNVQGELRIGEGAAANHLVVSNGGTVFGSDKIVAGFNSSSTNNRIVVDGGTLRTTKALDLRRGTNVLNAGLIEVNQLLLTNALGRFEFNGGKLMVGNSTVNNGQPFKVGNGASAATLELRGGTHSFANNLTIANNASLIGNGAVTGILTVQPGGVLAPGASIGKMVFSNSPSLQGAVAMEISKNGATITNDQIQVTAPLIYGGSLTVTNLGPTALAAGDRFQLFSANSYVGAFSVITLPSLPAGLDWANKLLVDGSIEAVATGASFTSVTLFGTNVVFSGAGGPPNASYAVLAATNVALPLNNWISIATNQCDPIGGFSFTNAIVPGIPQRFFRLRTP